MVHEWKKVACHKSCWKGGEVSFELMTWSFFARFFSLQPQKQHLKCHWSGMWRRLRNFHFLPPISQMIPSDNEPAFFCSLLFLVSFFMPRVFNPSIGRKVLMALNCSSFSDLDFRCKWKPREAGELDNRQKWLLNGFLFWFQWRNQELTWWLPLPLCSTNENHLVWTTPMAFPGLNWIF